MAIEKIHRHNFYCPATTRVLRQAQDERWHFFPAHGELLELCRQEGLACQELREFGDVIGEMESLNS